MNIVFDFGNVLVEWNMARLVREHYLTGQGLMHSADSASVIAADLIGHQDWLNFDLGLLGASELATRSAQRLGLDEAELRAFIEHIPHVLPVFEETVALMQSLADGADDVRGKHRVLYLSNMPTEYADVMEVRCPWIARFEGGIFSGRVNFAKPDPAIYAAAEQRLGLSPADTLFLDDSAHNVDAARARGWLAEVVTSPQSATSVRDALAKHGILRAA